MTQVIPVEQCQNGTEFINALLAQGKHALASLYRDPALHARAKKALDNLPKFAAEGECTGFVCYLGMEPSQWVNEQGVVYLVMYLFNPSQQKGDWWRGSTSPAYMTGNNADRTYAQNTLRQLEKVGGVVENGQWGMLVAQLLGKNVSFWVSENEGKNGKIYYRISALGERKVPEAMAMPGFDFSTAYPPAPAAIAVPGPAPAASAPVAAPAMQQPAPVPQYQQQMNIQQAQAAFGPAPQNPFR